MENIETDLAWWHSLTADWKEAFAQTCFMHSNEPTPLELAQLYNAPALRFAGPSAPYPNMAFELEDLSGLSQLHQLEILVVTHHRLESISEIRSLERLKGLFLNNNRIKSLEGIEDLVLLCQLYAQCNQLTSILSVKTLLNLEELYIHDNNINSLEGLTEEHAEKLQQVFCKPNEGLKQKEMLRLERDLGIRCRSL